MSPLRRRPNRERQSKGHQWAAAIELALDHAADRSAHHYQTWPLVRVLAVNTSGTRLEVELRFQAGQSYCCAEAGCHLPTSSRDWWERLRADVLAATGRNPPPLVLKVRGVVEEGATFCLHRSIGLAEASTGYTYDHGPCREEDAT